MSHQQKAIKSGVGFQLGNLVATPAFLEVVADCPHEMLNIIRRHVRCDWGDLDAEDKVRNDWSALNGERILSAYHINGTKVWVITERDRSVTTLLLPADY